MQLLELTLDTVAENLALDEALLEEAEDGTGPAQILRLWESPQPAVVVGRASRVEREVQTDECLKRGIPVYRRASGGAAVVIGPGCLMYSVVLSYANFPQLRMIQHAHEHVLGTILDAITPFAPGARFQGTSDLTIDGRKFSGNSLRCKRDHLLYHGTLLYEFPLESISASLRMPPRRPDYRNDRSHDDFVVNLPITANDLRRALANEFDARSPHIQWPKERTAQLASQRYSQDCWNLQR